MWRVARREMGQWFSCAATAADVCVWRRACGNRSMRSVAAVRRMHVGAEFPAGAGAGRPEPEERRYMERG